MGNFTPLKKVGKKPKKFFIIIGVIFVFLLISAFTHYLYLYLKTGKCIPKKLYCQRDNPFICLGNTSDRIGALCNSSGNGYDSCSGYDGCSYIIFTGSKCDGTGFRGCSQYNHQDNCFCVNSKFVCTPDVGGTACGLNLPGGEKPPLPTLTPLPTVSMPTIIPTPTLTTVPTSTPNPTPTTMPTIIPITTVGPTLAP